MARQPWTHDELVLINQSQFRQRHRQLHAADEQSLTGLLLELLNCVRQIPDWHISANQLRVPIDPVGVKCVRHDVLFCRIDRLGKAFHPIRPRYRSRWRPPCCLHHFVDHSAKEESIGAVEDLDRVTMQSFVRRDRAMIAASVQCDVDGISKGSHYVVGICWRAGWLGSVNSSSSMGAPFSTMNATRTPSDGLLGGIRISRPASSEARSATSNATCGTRRTRSGIAASASKRIHSTPNSLFSWLTTKTFRCFKWVSPGFASVVGIPMWWYRRIVFRSPWNWHKFY